MNYEEHVLLGLATYPLFVAFAFFLSRYLPLKLSFLALSLGYAFYVLGSDLPDIDHPDSLIHRGSKPLFSVAVGSVTALKVYPYLPYYPIVLSWVIGGVASILGWFAFTAMMPRHRGIVHSLLFAGIYGVLAFLLMRYGLSLSMEESLLVGLASFSGYTLHLIADRSVKLL
ncbi:metal-dependent hydrolase [Pyrococcus abyssi]|uniref:Membrane-bound metal-dependent hydrolase n=1 Tax=Pyrococcus abyssi (strain GE5 / Orsay) TaxID=272844 RepID=Q9V275_PYRAB|nr:metal-dependent hydrolase [Pyrococcus abyssi]CAB49123.1 Predicted membrane-bound metal-dependent hydrolase [Pyrococcus abyssi GE5]CCE69575.1 TPA: Membrane-bound metal-dependent hydrolase [Pyrococcus abyssi GE5]